MAERRQRSPESPPRRGKEPYRAQRSGSGRKRSGSESDSIYSSSSSSSSYIDISRYYPQNPFSLRKFFTAPSERHRIRKRRSQRSLRRGGSSSSIDSDLAYGTGFVHKHRGDSPGRGKELERPRPERYAEDDVRRDGFERHESREIRDRPGRHDQYETRETPERRDGPERSEGRRRRDKGKPGKRISRSPTEAEILAVGNEIRELSDLISSGRSRRTGGPARGLPPSKVSPQPDQPEAEDDDGWRTDDGHESADSVDSSLAYGGESGRGGWFSFSWNKPKPKPEPKPVPKKKSSVVDPRLFGRQNSLNGIITEPVGFEDVNYRVTNGFDSSRGQSPLAAKSKPASTSRSKSKPKSTVSDIPLQTVYPVSTEDPRVFEPARSSVSSGRQESYTPSRPAPPPIYHPQPITPVTQAIYDPHYATRMESAPLPKDSSRRGPSIAEAALAGVAAGAVGAVIASESKEERKGKHREDDQGPYDDGHRLKRREPDRYQNREEKPKDNYESTKDRDYGRDARHEQNRSDEPRDFPDEPSRKEDYSKQHVDHKDERDGKHRQETREERRARHREERRFRDSQNAVQDTREKQPKNRPGERPGGSTIERETVPEAPAPLNPFQYQVADDAFSTPNISRPSSRLTRSEITPIIHTVEREPSFVLKSSDSVKEQVSTQEPKPDIIARAVEQESRSTPSKDKPREQATTPEYESSMKYGGENDKRRHESGKRARKDSRGGELRKAEEIYNEVEHSTAPIDAAAIAAAAAVVVNETHRKSRSGKRRGEQHSEQRDDPRESESERRDPGEHRRREIRDEHYKVGSKRQDPEPTEEEIESTRILDEADKAYREIVMARKIASSVIRSRSSSRDRSVVNKYKEEEEEEDVKIVTPPSMEGHKRPGLYDAPNADIRLDHILIPQELPTFVVPNIAPNTSYPVARDPDAERERPLLTLIRPTPVPSPAPEKQAATSSEPTEQPPIEREIQRVVPDAVTDPTVDVEIAAREISPGEIEAESASVSEQNREPHPDIVENVTEREKKNSKKGRGWGIIAGIMGAAASAAIEGDTEPSEPKNEEKPEDHEKLAEKLPALPDVVAVSEERSQEVVADPEDEFPAPPDAITAEEAFPDSSTDREEDSLEDASRSLDLSAQDNSVENKSPGEKLKNVADTNLQEEPFGPVVYDSKDRADGSIGLNEVLREEEFYGTVAGSGVQPQTIRSRDVADLKESTARYEHPEDDFSHVAVAPENNPPDAVHSDGSYENEPLNLEMQPSGTATDTKAEPLNAIPNDTGDELFKDGYDIEVNRAIIPLDKLHVNLADSPNEPQKDASHILTSKPGDGYSDTEDNLENPIYNGKARDLDEAAQEPRGMPGSFTEDLGFLATVAAGLKDTGLDPDLVINNPSYLSRTSPPGSNDEGDSFTDNGELPARVGKKSKWKRNREDKGQLDVVLPLEETPLAKEAVEQDSPAPDSPMPSRKISIEALPSIEVSEKDKSTIDTSKLSKKELKVLKKRAKATQRQDSLTDNVTPNWPVGKDNTAEAIPVVSTEHGSDRKGASVQPLGQSSDHAIGNIFAQYFAAKPKADTSEPIPSTEIIAEEKTISDTPQLSKEEEKRVKVIQRQKSLSEDGTVQEEQSAERGAKKIMEESRIPMDTSVPTKAIELDTAIVGSPKIGKEEQGKFDEAAQQQSNLTECALVPGESPDEEIIEREIMGEVEAESESISETVSSIGPLEPNTVATDIPKLSKKERKRLKAARRQKSLAENPMPELITNTSAENEAQKVVPDAITDKVIVEEPQSFIEFSGDSKITEPDKGVDNRSEETPTGSKQEVVSPKNSKKSHRKSGNFEGSTPSEIIQEDNGDAKFSQSSQREGSVSHTSNIDNTQPVASVDASKVEDQTKITEDPKPSGKYNTDSARSITSISTTTPSSRAPEDLRDSNSGRKKKNSGSLLSFFTSKFDLSTATNDSSSSPLNNSKNLENETTKSIADTSVTTISNDLTNISNGKGHNDGYENDTPKSNVRDESFLDNADTLGAGVGVAGAAAAQHLHGNASNANSNETTEHLHTGESGKGIVEEHGGEPVPESERVIDPEITERQIRPAIDPQYGDLLPLPPSNPSSPPPNLLDDLPDLPDSRAGTPENERMKSKEKANSTRKTPQHRKTPSQSAVPLKFIMGNRSTPSSPASAKSLPFTSTSPTARSRPRPASWENDTNEYKPLYLVETARRESSVNPEEPEESLPDLPTSGESSQTSSQLGLEDEEAMVQESSLGRYQESDMSIDTALTSSYGDVLGSGQSTPKALVPIPDIDESGLSRAESPKIPSPLRLTDTKEVFDKPITEENEETKSNIEVLDQGPLTSTIGYFASSTTYQATNESWLKRLPKKLSMDENPPEPVVSMTKDRTSRLLESPPFDRYTDSDDGEIDVDASPTSHKRTISADDKATLTSKVPVNRILFQASGALRVEEEESGLQQDLPLLDTATVDGKIDIVAGQVPDETTLHTPPSTVPASGSSAAEDVNERTIQPVTEEFEPSQTAAVPASKAPLEPKKDKSVLDESNLNETPSEVARVTMQEIAPESLAEPTEDKGKEAENKAAEIESDDKTVPEEPKDGDRGDNILEPTNDKPIEDVDSVMPSIEDSKMAEKKQRDISIDVSDFGEGTLPKQPKDGKSKDRTDVVTGFTEEPQLANVRDFAMSPAGVDLATAQSGSQGQGASIIAGDTANIDLNEAVQHPESLDLAVPLSESAEKSEPALVSEAEESQLTEAGENNIDSTDIRGDVEDPEDVLDSETAANESKGKKHKSVTIVGPEDAAVAPINELVTDSETNISGEHTDTIEESSEPVAPLLIDIDKDKAVSPPNSLAIGEPFKADQFAEGPDALTDSSLNITESGTQSPLQPEDVPLPSDIPESQETQVSESKGETQSESSEMTISKSEPEALTSTEQTSATTKMPDNIEVESPKILDSIMGIEMNQDPKPQREDFLGVQPSEDGIAKDNMIDEISEQAPGRKADQFDPPDSKNKQIQEESVPTQTLEQQEEASTQLNQQISESVIINAAENIPAERKEGSPDTVVKLGTVEERAIDGLPTRAVISTVAEAGEPNHHFQTDSKPLEASENSTPMSSGLYEQNKSTSYVDYFPSTATLNRQRTSRNSNIKEQNITYFPSSAALLPVAAAKILLGDPVQEHDITEKFQNEQKIFDNASAGMLPESETVRTSPQSHAPEDSFASKDVPIDKSGEPHPLANQSNDELESDYKESKGKEVETAQQSNMIPDTPQAITTVQDEEPTKTVAEEETMKSPIEKVIEKPIPIASEHVISQPTKGKKEKKGKKGRKNTQPEEDLANQPDTGVTSAKPASEEISTIEDPAINSTEGTITEPLDSTNTGTEKSEEEQEKILSQPLLETSDNKSVDATRTDPTELRTSQPEAQGLNLDPVRDATPPTDKENHNNSQQLIREQKEENTGHTSLQSPDLDNPNKLQPFPPELGPSIETSMLDPSSTEPREEIIALGSQSDILNHLADTDKDIPKSPPETNKSKNERKKDLLRAVTPGDTDDTQTLTEGSSEAISGEGVATFATESFVHDKESRQDEDKDGCFNAPGPNINDIPGTATDPNADSQTKDPKGIEANPRELTVEGELPDSMSHDTEIGEDTSSMSIVSPENPVATEVATTIEAPSTVVGPIVIDAPAVLEDLATSEIAGAAEGPLTVDVLSVAELPFNAMVASAAKSLPTDEPTSIANPPEVPPTSEINTISETPSTVDISIVTDTHAIPTAASVIEPLPTADASINEAVATTEVPASSETPTHTEFSNVAEVGHIPSAVHVKEHHLSKWQLKKLKKKQRLSLQKSENLKEAHPGPAPSEVAPVVSSAPSEELLPAPEAKATQPSIKSDESTVPEIAVASETPALQTKEQTAEENVDLSPITKAELQEEKQDHEDPPDKMDTSSQEIPANNSMMEPVSLYGEVHPLIQDADVTSNAAEPELNPTEKNLTESSIDREDKEKGNDFKPVTEEKKKKKKKSKATKDVEEASGVSTTQEPIVKQDSTEEPKDAQENWDREPISLDMPGTKEHATIVENMSSADHISDHENKKVDEMEDTKPLQANPRLNRDVSGFQDTSDPMKDILSKTDPSETPISSSKEIEVNASTRTESIPDAVVNTLTEDIIPGDTDASTRDLPTDSYKPFDREIEQQAIALESSSGATAIIPVETPEDSGDQKNVDPEIMNDLPSASQEMSISGKDMAAKSPKNKIKATTIPEIMPETSEAILTAETSDNSESQKFESTSPTMMSKTLDQTETQQMWGPDLNTVTVTAKDSEHFVASLPGNDSQNVVEEREIGLSPVDVSEPSVSVPLQESPQADQHDGDSSDTLDLHLRKSTDKIGDEAVALLEEQAPLSSIEISKDFAQTSEQVNIPSAIEGKTEAQSDERRFSFDRGLVDVADVQIVNAEVTAPELVALAENQQPETEQCDELSRNVMDEQVFSESTRFIGNPVEHLISSINAGKFARLSTPTLPSVKEEEDTQVEAETLDLAPVRRLDGSQDPNRDSGFVTDSPIPQQHKFPDVDEHVRDSGVHLREWSPATPDQPALLPSPPIDKQTEAGNLHKPREIIDEGIEHKTASSHLTISDQPSRCFQETQEPRGTLNHLVQQQGERLDTRQSQDNRGPPRLRRSSTARERGSLDKTENPIPRTPKLNERYPELDHSLPKALKPQSIVDDTVLVGAGLIGTSIASGISTGHERRPDSAMSVQSAPGRRSSANTNRLRTPDPKMRSESAGSIRSAASSGTPPLRRSDRKFSGDLRSLSQQNPESQRSSQHSKFDLAKEAVFTPTPTLLHHANPTANEGRVRIKDMADVYDGFGEGRMGSPMSPTRPHSMRRRQSLQVLDLEAKVEQLTSENLKLAEARAHAENSLKLTQRAAADLADRDAEIESLKATINWLHAEVTRLSEVNDGLTSANITLGNQQNDRYGALERQHAQTSRELEEMREAHSNLAAGMDGIVADQVRTAVEEKDNQIARLRAELEAAQETIRETQQQILAAKPSDGEFLTVRDEDYFDMACQQLCQHVQQWVLRFSKFSDMRACRLTSEINNDKIIDRLDNAILDGSDVDSYLADRVRRRDVFMSMTMTMIWEFVFTRYLFGMDREQRQKLKSLEKLLLEVGPPSAVHQWRATTLTLLSKREAFRQQRAKDTEAVVNEILKTLFTILPPPSHLEDQIQHQLTRVMRSAVDLSIEMRTQRAEYMMLPPLQPEYDANGDLASKVTFNASLMNERSGNAVSNEELEAQSATVRIVLFPLVVKKGDDMGAGDEEIVVCPAQVLVANDAPRERRVSSRGSNRSNQSSLNNNSRVSLPSAMPSEI